MKKDSGNSGGGNSGVAVNAIGVAVNAIGVAVNAMHIMHTFGVFQF